MDLSLLITPQVESILFIVARVIAGVVMMHYGWPKVKNLKSNAKDFVHMGFKPGWLFGTIVAFLEFFGGIAIILGLFIPYVAILFGFEMLLGFFWKVTKTKKPFTDYSYDLILLALMIMFVLYFVV